MEIDYSSLIKKVKCPLCKRKVKPISMCRDDTLKVTSKDGYILDDRYTVAVPVGWMRFICWNCKYVFGEYRNEDIKHKTL